ncbi:IS3 family transposase [Streptomyces sp. ITFR-16]|uniref:IS3 family transposase n=1 Tax=Streptomyces sp. ITFR-16 TaxID=3075198 RepID=UPI00288A1351|nr:IS3 family transposase [Streptomyces sp. ITFR-16]WNI21414.1 IS3 family transposase [Streptomyces sp. ITFR-16]
MSELHRLIHAEKANYPVMMLCRVLHVARSSYYAWREGEAARQARRAADDALAHKITLLHVASRKTYGLPRIHAELRRLGRRVNRKRVARVMGERDIRGVTRRNQRTLTRPDAKAKPAPDLIGCHFHAERPGTKLVGDITYLPTAEGWHYLACWLDLATPDGPHPPLSYSVADLGLRVIRHRPRPAAAPPGLLGPQRGARGGRGETRPSSSSRFDPWVWWCLEPDSNRHTPGGSEL